MENTLHSAAVYGSNFIGDCFDICKPYLDKDNEILDPLVRFVCAQLYINSHLTTESALILINYQKEWDADILSRTVLEGTLKFVYIISGQDENEKKNLAWEYWEVLPKLASVKRSDRANAFLDCIDGYDKDDYIPIKDLILSDEEHTRILAQFDRKTRKALEQKWSLMEIMNRFNQSGDNRLVNLAKLAFTYGMSSHLVHQDGVGTSIVWDRYQRSQERKDAAMLGHISRIVSDVCVMAQVRSHFLLKACGGSVDELIVLRQKYHQLFEILQQCCEYFYQVEYGIPPASS